VYNTYRPTTSEGNSNNFTICGKFDSAAVSSPEADIGTPVTITWATTGAIPADQVQLIYYKDGDIASEQIIDPAVTSKTSPYVWNIPSDIAGTYINVDLRIRAGINVCPETPFHIKIQIYSDSKVPLARLTRRRQAQAGL